MLVLSRRVMERILIGDKIVVTVLEIAGGRVRIGLDAPADVTILRDELSYDTIEEEVKPKDTN